MNGEENIGMLRFPESIEEERQVVVIVEAVDRDLQTTIYR
jgi:hypothetical protein